MTVRPLLRALCLTSLIGLTGPMPLAAQGANVAFGITRQDPSAPVEVTADNLDVDQATGAANFAGNVVIVQGEMRISADEVVVVYSRDRGRIERFDAMGDVVLVSGPDAAEAQRAEYDIDAGVIVMTGDVLVKQGQSALSAERMTVDLDGGTARMSGRVRTILQTGQDR